MSYRFAKIACQECGVIVSKTHSRQKYCTQRCYAHSMLGKRQFTVQCCHCHQIVPRTHCGQKYCSNQCRGKAMVGQPQPRGLRQRKQLSIQEHIERMLAKVEKQPNGCWKWLGPVRRDGYGSRMFHGDTWSAPRLFWTLIRGPIPAGLHLLHRCDFKLCINPDHLFPGTRSDNMKDCAEKGRLWFQRRPRTVCPNGHPYPESSHAGRRCADCARQQRKVWSRRRREAGWILGTVNGKRRWKAPIADDLLPIDITPINRVAERLDGTDEDWVRG